MAAYDYGHARKLREAHPGLPLPKLLDPGSAIIEFKADPAALPAGNVAAPPPIRLGVCVWINDKKRAASTMALPDGIFHPRREDHRDERWVGRQHHRLALRAHRVQRTRRAVFGRPDRTPVRLLMAILAATVITSCRSPVPSPPLTREELAALDYGRARRTTKNRPRLSENRLVAADFA